VLLLYWGEEVQEVLGKERTEGGREEESKCKRMTPLVPSSMDSQSYKMTSESWINYKSENSQQGEEESIYPNSHLPLTKAHLPGWEYLVWFSVAHLIPSNPGSLPQGPGQVRLWGIVGSKNFPGVCLSCNKGVQQEASAVWGSPGPGMPRASVCTGRAHGDTVGVAKLNEPPSSTMERPPLNTRAV
jgi:hypothetical protein